MKKYSIIYADPPWRYKVYSKKGLGRSAESHYPTMELEDIRALPVGTLAADDCVLFLWTTIPLLHDCFSVMRAWGFSYKTVAFVWIKQNRKSDSLFWGMGHWTRANAEFCMLATKGRPKRRSAGVHQVILSHIEEHSKLMLQLEYQALRKSNPEICEAFEKHIREHMAFLQQDAHGAQDIQNLQGGTEQ